MRKWIGVFLVLILTLGIIYWLTRGTTRIEQKLGATTNTKAFVREFLNEQTWQQWWPEKEKFRQGLPATFTFNGNTYTLAEKKLSSVEIIISNGKDSALTELVFIPVRNDSIELSWFGLQKNLLNPVSRMQYSNWIKNINSDIHFLLKKIASHYSSKDNVYGFHIQNDIVIDSNLVSTSAQLTFYPGTEFIYKMIDRLKSYIQKNAAKESNPPMLNITQLNDGTFFTRVAIPVNKKLHDSGDIKYRWMLGGGNILVTEVKGGPSKIQLAFKKMEEYVQDHHHVSPAIPFQSLITDRRLEPDTNKWITKVYWPVM